ncbi:MAG: DUF4339 domain-containing protein [Armatimonadetes bacterium]|nr:DUF4339 domain-containing protein [Armatimonadota bacterium]
MFNWYYVGQYGQLGPLSEEQMLELVEAGVVEGDTYVWKRGMPDWVRADGISELREALAPKQPPPPPPEERRAPPAEERSAPPVLDPVAKYSMQAYYGRPEVHAGAVSPHSRAIAGVLQLIPPGGIGRMYLGYWAIGILQMLLTVCTCGMLYVWPFVDAIVVLSGGVKFDGYGRMLE